jgi:hypothetical protein
MFVALVDPRTPLKVKAKARPTQALHILLLELGPHVLIVRQVGDVRRIA